MHSSPSARPTRRPRPEPEPARTLEVVLDSLVDPLVLLKSVRDERGAITDFVYTAANRAACAYTGLDHDRLVGATVVELLPGHMATGLFDMYVHVMATGEPLVLDDYPYLSELHGEERRFDIRAARIDDGLVYTWRDVTERLERAVERARVLSMEALADERDRVARDLHDGAIQEVYGTAMSLRAIAAEAPEPLRSRLAGIVDAQDTIIRHLRATVLGLTRPVLEETGPIELVTRTVAEAERSLGFVPDLRVQGGLDTLDDPLVVEHLLLSLREMLSNVARHAQASTVEVAVVVTPGSVEVAVNDDGIGLDAATTKGYGLTNLATRAAVLGGVFSLAERPAGGACARWRVPRGRPAAAVASA